MKKKKKKYSACGWACFLTWLGNKEYPATKPEIYIQRKKPTVIDTQGNKLRVFKVKIIEQ